MSTRMNIVMSDELSKAIDQAATEGETTKSEVLRKAIQLYIASVDAKKRGLKIGIAKPEQQLETEFIGL